MLVRQLQDQHYQQYIQQLAVDQRLANSNIQQVGDSEKETNNEEVKIEKTLKDCNLNDTVFEALADNNK